jgi:hypothetical protein
VRSTVPLHVLQLETKGFIPGGAAEELLTTRALTLAVAALAATTAPRSTTATTTVTIIRQLPGPSKALEVVGHRKRVQEKSTPNTKASRATRAERAPDPKSTRSFSSDLLGQWQELLLFHEAEQAAKHTAHTIPTSSHRRPQERRV